MSHPCLVIASSTEVDRQRLESSSRGPCRQLSKVDSSMLNIIGSAYGPGERCNERWRQSCFTRQVNLLLLQPKGDLSRFHRAKSLAMFMVASSRRRIVGRYARTRAACHTKPRETPTPAFHVTVQGLPSPLPLPNESGKARCLRFKLHAFSAQI